MERPAAPSPPQSPPLLHLPTPLAALHLNASDVAPPLPAAPGGVGLSQPLALCAMVAVDVLAVAGNLAVMAAIARAPQLRKFAFVFHLCLVDLLAALVLMPLGMLSGRVLAGEAPCRGYHALSVGLASAAILTICAINIERYYYVAHPMRHEVKMTVGLVRAVLVGIWLKAAVMAALPLLGWLLQGDPGPGLLSPHRHCSLHWTGGRTARLLFTVFFALIYFLCPVLLILVVYCNMFKLARVAGTPRGPLPTWTGAEGAPQRSFGGGKAAAVLAAVGGQFICCWLPFFSFHLYSASAAAPPAALARLEEAVTWIGYFCFSSNPFFYGYLNRQIRAELGRCLARLLKRAGPGEGEQLPSREASIEENFLQFLQGTGRNLQPCNSHGKTGPEERQSEPVQESAVRQSTPADLHVPGQILEETSEFMQQLNNELHRDNCCKTLPEL
ncbi:G-protein coupled receptor 61 [Betta splendens]|uniref:G-protein coupled receptor 61 n=1 Tax=Betta splendens TaxID=158456 RepID=A0A6P7N242_BETSP|nr:G-protein coupled receptor 61 [Betta splendens]